MNGTIDIDCIIDKEGLIVKFQNKDFILRYPEKIWANVPQSVKEALRDNFALATTMHLPMILPGIKGINFTTARPILEPYFFQNFLRDIPSCTVIDGTNTNETVRKFLQIEYKYPNLEIKYPGNSLIKGEKAIIGLSFGKDSLLTYAVANEIGLNPEIVYVVEQSLKYEEKHKIELGKQFKKEFGKDLHIIIHETGKLRDYEYLQLPKSEFGWGLQSTEYALDLIPYAYAFNGKYILFGNEQSAAASFYAKDKWLVYPCYDQTHIWTKHIDQMVQLFTGRSTRVGSIIEPLMDMMIQRILIRRYPELAKYQMSCFTETEAGKDYRWCQECSVCSKMYLLSVASGMDPRKIGFNKNMLNREYKNLFNIFNGKSTFAYTETRLFRDEQLFTFYLAAKKGVNAELVEDFKKTTMFKEAKEREEELFKIFCSLYESVSIPNELKSKVLSIYKEELNLFEI